MRRLFLLAAILLSLTPGTAARQAAPAPPELPSAASPSAEARKTVTTYTLPPEKHAKAVALARTGYTLYFIGFFYGLAVLLGLLYGGIAAQFRDCAERISLHPACPAHLRTVVQVGIFTALLLVTLRLLRLPLAAYGHSLLVRYELSVQGWGSWLWDWTKNLFVAVAIGAFLVWMLYAVIRRSPQRWWFYFWLALLPVVLAGVLLHPLVVDPLFYNFTPLERTRPEVVAEIQKVVQRGGLDIPRERIFEMDASRKLRVANAYVTGIGPSKRVVVWDTSLEMLTTPQALALFGHEMGHYVLNHVPKGIAVAAVVLFVFLYLSFRALGWALARWGPRWAVRSADDWASLPVLMLLAALFQFAALPATNAFSRYVEHQADVYGLEITHGVVPDATAAAAEMHQITAEAALEDPDPQVLIRFWFYDHPSTRDRIEFAVSYDPWSKGQQPGFVK